MKDFSASSQTEQSIPQLNVSHPRIIDLFIECTAGGNPHRSQLQTEQVQ